MALHDAEMITSPLSDQCTTDCESEGSFESWMEEDNIDANNNANENDYLDLLANELRLKYSV